MRGVAMQREDAAINHRIAAEPVGDAPAERLTVILPRQGPAEQLWPLVVALVGAIDFRGDGELVRPGSGEVQLDRTPILQPGIGVDPQIGLIAGEVARQKRPRELRLAHLRGAVAVREIDVPAGVNQMRDPLGEPFPLFRLEPDIENPDCRIGRRARIDSTVSRRSGKYPLSAPLTINRPEGAVIDRPQPDRPDPLRQRTMTCA